MRPPRFAMPIYLIVLSCVLVHAGFGGAKVALPLHALNLGVDPFTVGVMMALWALCPMLIALYVGKLVDRVGPRVPMVGGTLGVMVALLVPYFFPGVAALYVMALAVGTAFQFFFVPAQGITGALGGPEDRARNYSLLAVGFSIASFLGPLIAGFSIDYLGYRAAYLALASCVAAAVLLLWLKGGLLPKAAVRTGEEPKKSSSFELLRNGRLRDAIVASGLISIAWDLYQFYFPIYGHSIGLSASVIGMVISTFAIAVFAIRLALPSLVRRWGEFGILLYAIGFAGAVFVLFPFFRDPYLLALASFLLGLGCGVGQPMSMSLIYSLSPPGRASEGAGLRVMFNHFMHLVVPLAFGGIGTAFGFTPVFVSCSALLLGSSYYGHLVERQSARSRP
ncbi:MAG: MFS transporter [Betaproteobacteria bacterium]|nr:MFS transporter [Betaproteobacteria bacterium]